MIEKEYWIKVVSYFIAMLFAMFFVNYVINYGEYAFLSHSQKNTLFDYYEFMAFHFIILFVIQAALIIVPKTAKVERLIVNMYGPILILFSRYHIRNSYIDLLSVNNRVHIFNVIVTNRVFLAIVGLYFAFNILFTKKRSILYIILSGAITLIGYSFMLELLTDSV